MDGKLNQYPLAIKGSASGNDKMEWTIPALALQSGPNQLQAKGSLSQQAWKLDADLNAPTWPGSTPASRGHQGAGAPDRQSAGTTGHHRAGCQPPLLCRHRSEGIAIKGNALVGDKPAGKWPDGGQPGTGATSLSQLALNLSGDLNQHALSLTMKGDPVAANLKLSGGLRGDRWRGALSELKLKTPLRRWELSAPWALDLDLPRQR